MVESLNFEFLREKHSELSALREAIVNALAHRDYRSNANVQIYIFEDRLEIVSPGGLPAGMTPELLGIKSIPRNPLLFGMLYRMNAVEQVGSGVRRIREICKDYGVAKPDYEIREHWVTITFKRPELVNGVRIPEEKSSVKGSVKGSVKSSVKILALLKQNGEMTIPELSEQIGITTRAIEKNIKKLQEGGALRRVGPDKGGHWEVRS